VQSRGYLHQDPNLDPEETLRGAAEQAFAKLHALHLQLDRLYHDISSASERGEDAEVERLLKKTAQVETEIEQGWRSRDRSQDRCRAARAWGS
jgi:uncharacterized protein YdcH (DUF465 family)